jgi:hypothetical protein
VPGSKTLAGLISALDISSNWSSSLHAILMMLYRPDREHWMADRISHQFDASTAMFRSTKGPSGVLEALLSQNGVDGSKSLLGCIAGRLFILAFGQL